MQEENEHISKWGSIIDNLLIIDIPFEYARRVYVFNDEKEYTVTNFEEYQTAILDLLKIEDKKILSVQHIRYEIDFNIVKLRKEVERRVDSLFSKFFKESF